MRLQHGRVELELHELAARSQGQPLLLLHELYASGSSWGEGFAPWPGPVYALDFVGHGRSGWVKGGAYTPEILAADVDAALHHIGSAAIVGAGVGAYVALLVAGARRDRVAAALLLPGAGLAGGGPLPDFEREAKSVADLAVPRPSCDPMVTFLEHDVRPLDYVEAFAQKTRKLILLEDGGARPPWWETTRRAGATTSVADLAAGLGQL